MYLKWLYFVTTVSQRASAATVMFFTRINSLHTVSTISNWKKSDFSPSCRALKMQSERLKTSLNKPKLKGATCMKSAASAWQATTQHKATSSRGPLCDLSDSLLRCIISIRNQKRAKGKAAPASKYLKKTPCLEEARTIGFEPSAPHQQLQISKELLVRPRFFLGKNAPSPPQVPIRKETAGPERGSKEQLNISLLLEGLGQLPSRQQPVTATMRLVN